jgi:hypothetical protein
VKLSAGIRAAFTQVKVAARREPSTAPTEPSSLGASPMLDVILLAVALGFFALSVGYIFACDRL